MAVGWQRLIWMQMILVLISGESIELLQAQEGNFTRGLVTDTEGLLSFKHRIEKDPEGILNGWNEQISSNSCDWFGITCANARVVALNLNNLGLVAPLPTSALAPLDQLKEVRLSHNAFYGYSSDQVVSYACNALTVLDLSSNNLNGSFSNVFLQDCKTLAYLNISHNGFYGSFPANLLLSDVSSVRWLDLSHNYFSGALPSNIFLHCGALSWLDLSSNNLSSGLPSGISRCASLQHLDISFNFLNGTLPSDIFPVFSTNLTHLQLSSNDLSGVLPPIASCSKLAFLDLSDNTFTGQIPSSLGACTSLRLLNMSENAFIGNIPIFSTSLVSLEILSLSGNNLTGSIPPEIGYSLLALQELDVSVNELVGTIPPFLSNLTSLHLLNLGSNGISGEFPVAVVSRMQSLRTLILSFNNLTGRLPASLPNTSSLVLLDLSANSFTGSIPGTICGPSLRTLLLADNELTGSVPLGSCTSLIAIDVSCNLLSSTFPRPLPILPYLQEFVIWGNLIQEELPPDICSAASLLRLLVLNVNLINGTIPSTLANCSSLEWLSLSNNLLTGSIPPELGFMSRIGFLHLNNNSLSGTIPPTLGECRYLVWVDLSSNQLVGGIPPELAKQAGKVIKGTLDGRKLHLAFFKYLLADACTKYGLGSVLTMVGVRPESVYDKIPNFWRCNRTRLYRDIEPYYIPGPPGSSQGGSFTYLDIANNKLSGTIPEELGRMTYLTVLSLSYNNFTGSIPSSLANLIRCSILHLDHNNLQGPIPPALSRLGIVNQLDFSYNNLSGPIPDSGKLPTFPASSYINNPYLCGTPLPPCSAHDPTSYEYSPQGDVSTASGSSRVWFSLLICLIVMGSFLLLMGVLLAYMFCSHHRIKQDREDNYEENFFPSTSASQLVSFAKKPLSINLATYERPLRKIPYAQLHKATNGFSPEAIIGRGGFGDVYKATLEDGSIAAVKKLVFHGEKEFISEMETIGKIKHRNLVPLLGYCKMAKERMLVYEYMEGGSLDNWLHGSMQQEDTDGQPEGDHMDNASNSMPMRGLSWDRRKRIALGTARGLCFLHNSCIPHIIHRDLKSANVLLDDALEARVSDFGTARLVSASESHLTVSTLVGTPGYVPPEYSQLCQCTREGDVYSFGVVLLELITGRRPTWSYSFVPRTAPTFTANTEQLNDSNVFVQAVSDDEGGGVDLVGWVKRRVREGRVREVLDQRVLKGKDSMMETVDLEKREREMLGYLSIACRCVNERPSFRPTMVDVIAELRQLHRGQDLDLIQ